MWSTATSPWSGDEVADDRDGWGRFLRYVEVGGADAGRQLLEQVLVTAWAPTSAARPSRLSDYAEAATQARDRGRGAWSSCGPEGPFRGRSSDAHVEHPGAFRASMSSSKAVYNRRRNE